MAAVERATGSGLSEQDQEAFREGVNTVLSYLEGFWLGLAANDAPEGASTQVQHQAA